MLANMGCRWSFLSEIFDPDNSSDLLLSISILLFSLKFFPGYYQFFWSIYFFSLMLVCGCRAAIFSLNRGFFYQILSLEVRHSRGAMIILRSRPVFLNFAFFRIPDFFRWNISAMLPWLRWEWSSPDWSVVAAPRSRPPRRKMLQMMMMKKKTKMTMMMMGLDLVTGWEVLVPVGWIDHVVMVIWLDRSCCHGDPCCYVRHGMGTYRLSAGENLMSQPCGDSRRVGTESDTLFTEGDGSFITRRSRQLLSNSYLATVTTATATTTTERVFYLWEWVCVDSYIDQTPGFEFRTVPLFLE